ncbi:MAG: hypothetical protein Q9214_005161, partial [Letrouitia sp. 1 TL-2023]
MSTTEDDLDFGLNAAASSGEFAAHRLTQAMKTISPPIERSGKSSSSFVPIKAEQVESIERDASGRQALASIPEASRKPWIDEGQPKPLMPPSQIFSTRLTYQLSFKENAQGQAAYHQHTNSKVERQPSKISINTAKDPMSQPESSVHQTSGSTEHEVPVAPDVRHSNQLTNSDNAIRPAARNPQKSPPSISKNRGRPPGSKNKEPQKSRNDVRLESPTEAKQGRVKNLKLSNIMKRIWAQRKIGGVRTGDDIQRPKLGKSGSIFRKPSTAQLVLQPRDQSNRQRYQSPDPRAPYNANETKNKQEDMGGQSYALLASWKSNDQRLTDFFRAVVANDTITPKLAAYLKETGYILDDRQVKVIKRYIKDSFASKAKLLASQNSLRQSSQNNDGENLEKNLDRFGSLEQLTGIEDY